MSKLLEFKSKDQKTEPVDIEKKLYDLEQKIGMLEVSLTLARNCQKAYKKQFKQEMLAKYGTGTTEKEK